MTNKLAAKDYLLPDVKQRTGLKLSNEQAASLGKRVEEVDLIAQRVRSGIKLTDEPAAIFKTPRA